MAIDFGKPTTTDNYSSAFVPGIQANQTALAQWLDSGIVTITGTPPTNAKRYNRTSSNLEEYNGSAWVALKVNGITFDGSAVLIGANTAAYGKLNIERWVAAPYATFTITDQATPANEVGIYLRANGSNPAGISTAGAPLAFYLGGPGTSEAARLTATGLGIGGTAAYKLDVFGVLHSNNAVFVSHGVQGDSSGFTFSGLGSKYGRVWEAANDRWALGFSGSYGGASTEVLSWVGAGNITANAPSSGITFTAVAVAGTSPSILFDTTTSTNAAFGRYHNANGNCDAGVDNSTGSTLGSGFAYDFTIKWAASAGFSLVDATTGLRFRISSTGSATLYAPSSGDGLTVNASALTPGVAVTFSATAMTVNTDLSNVFTTTFTANVTVAPTLSNASDGQTINWFITQDATGTRTMTWPTSFKWPSGIAGVLSTAVNAVDLLTATYRSSTGFWYASLLKGWA